MSKSTKSHFSRRRPRSALLGLLLVVGTFWLAACGGPTVTPSVVKVEIEQANPTLEVGGTVTLTTKVTVLGGASKAVTWESSDEAVATVTGSGLVTAVAEGSATVTATSVGSPTRTASVEVTVVPVGAGPAVISVEIDQLDPSLEVGGTVTLTANVTVIGGASQEVTWSSSNDAVASVTGAGVVTAVSVGTATVTATTVGLPTMTASVVVTVVPVGAGPNITFFTGTVVAGSQAELSWAVTNATSINLYSFDPNDDTDRQVIGSYPGSSTDATVALPDSTHQAFRLEATNAEGTVSRDLDPLDNVVVNNQDYDPYDLRGWVPEPSIPGSLRSVLASAQTGAIIGFASDITSINVRGVDLIPVGGGVVDSHLILRHDVTISGPAGAQVTLQGMTAWQTGDPGDQFTYESRVIYVPVGVTATLENLVITGGTFIYTGAGIHNAGTLTVRGSSITDNRAFGSGGAIRNLPGANLTMIDSSIMGNTAATLDVEIDHDWYIRGSTGDPAQFPGINGTGGGLFNEGTATLTNVDVSNNIARQSSGGIHNMGTMTLNGVTVDGNVANHLAAGFVISDPTDYSYGGGIANYANLSFTTGALTNNLATDQGGGLFHGVNAMTNLANVAITNNAAGVTGVTGYGGGIMQRYYVGEINHLVRTGGTLSGNTPQDLIQNDDGIRGASLGQLGGTTFPASLTSEGLKW